MNERDEALISSAHRMITFANPSIKRLLSLVVFGIGLSFYYLSIENESWSWIVNLLATLVLVIAMVETSRFSYIFSSKFNGWYGLATIIIGYMICYYLARLSEFLDLGPINKTAGWSLLVWAGWILGVLMYHATKDDKDTGKRIEACESENISVRKESQIKTLE
ncbi:MAG: hypothetical protein QM504_06895 [Pseudomonadota bacterium]